jgi:uncharacterized protein YfaS (alpha-2-macroglobulin family)
MEFRDMAKVHDVYPALIERTRRWLLSQRKADGSWEVEGLVTDDAQLRTTAYIAWAAFAGQPDADSNGRTKDFLLRHKPDSIADPYVLALVCNALLALDKEKAAPYLERLESLKTSQGDKLVSWKQAGRETAFHGSGISGDVETTSLAVLALLPSGKYPATCRGALSWLVGQKDAAGTWHSTQATVLALKALLAGTENPLGDRERRIEVRLGKGQKHTIVVAKDQGDVMQQIDLTADLAAGANLLSLTETTGTGAGYQLAFRYHVDPALVQAKPGDGLEMDVTYNRKDVKAGDWIDATATVRNPRGQDAPMVMLELPIPAGFDLDASALATLLQQEKLARYQVNGRQATIYLMGVKANSDFSVKYRLQARQPVKVTVPAARAYEYYDPDKQGRSRTVELTVTGR